MGHMYVSSVGHQPTNARVWADPTLTRFLLVFCWPVPSCGHVVEGYTKGLEAHGQRFLNLATYLRESETELNPQWCVDNAALELRRQGSRHLHHPGPGQVGSTLSERPDALVSQSIAADRPSDSDGSQAHPVQEGSRLHRRGRSQGSITARQTTPRAPARPDQGGPPASQRLLPQPRAHVRVRRLRQRQAGLANAEGPSRRRLLALTLQCSRCRAQMYCGRSCQVRRGVWGVNSSLTVDRGWLGRPTSTRASRHNRSTLRARARSLRVTQRGENATRLPPPPCVLRPALGCIARGYAASLSPSRLVLRLCLLSHRLQRPAPAHLCLRSSCLPWTRSRPCSAND